MQLTLSKKGQILCLLFLAAIGLAYGQEISSNKEGLSRELSILVEANPALAEVISREVSIFANSEDDSLFPEVTSRELSIVVPDESVPAPVTGVTSAFVVTTSTTAFGAVTLDWTSYNQLLQKDIVRYRVYISDNFFDSVIGLEPYSYLPLGSQRQTLAGLTGGRTYHFAVVAEDALGGFNPSAYSYAAQASAEGIGEVDQLSIASGQTSLNFKWIAPQGTANFLQGYRLYFNGTDVPVTLPSSATEWSATELAPGKEYALRVTTLSVLGSESEGRVIQGATWLANPSSPVITKVGDEVVLSWNSVLPKSLVQYYAIYRSDFMFNDVSGMTPLMTRTGTSAVLGEYAEVATKYFAVRVINTSNGSSPSVTPVRATKQSQTINFPPLAVGTSEIPLLANASSGLPVSFVSNSNQVAVVESGFLRVKQGGAVTVTAQQPGNNEFWPIEESQNLRMPPIITGFLADGKELNNEAVLSNPVTELRVTAKDVTGIGSAHFYGRVPGEEWMLLGLDDTPGNGFTKGLSVEERPDGPYELRVVVTTPDGGYASDRVQMVRLNVKPILTLSLGTELQEGGVLNGSVSIQRARQTDLLVTLSSSQRTQLDAGPPVMIPAGQTSTPISMTAQQDFVVEPPISIRLTASAPGAASVEQVVTVVDEDWPIITLAVDKTAVAENAGADAIQAKVQRDVVTPLPVTVWLSNNLPNDLVVQSSVVIPGGSSSVVFPIGTVDNDLVDGHRTAVLRAEVKLPGIGVIVESSAVNIAIGDDEGPGLEITSDVQYVSEGESAIVRVGRLRTPTTSALPIVLASSSPAELQIPTSVTIPAGASEIAFAVHALSNGSSDGNKTVRVTAASDNFSPGQLQLVVTGGVLPDLVVNNLNSPNQVETESLFSVTWQVANTGKATATGSFVQRVFLSKDRLIGQDILLGQSTFPGGLAVGAQFSRTENVRAPREAGEYWVIVTTDASEGVDEILETNNTIISASPIVVTEAYSAWVQTETIQAPANTPIVFTGSAIRNGGTKVSNALVSIHIKLGSTHRVIPAITDVSGNFETTWQPLPGEGGDYEVAASHPGTTEAATQDMFTILTINAQFPENVVTLEEAGSTSFIGTLTNPTTHNVSGVNVQVEKLPHGVSVNVSLTETSIAPGGLLEVGVTVTAASGFSGHSDLNLRLTTGQGIMIEVPVIIFVRPQLPKLVASPNLVHHSALRGVQTLALVTLENQGSSDSGHVDLLLPDVPWMQLASQSPLPNIPPGASGSFSILLTPAATDELTVHNGNLVVSPANGVASNLPFSIRVVSDKVGDLSIDVVDEAFYYTEGAPKVKGAIVTVRDAVTAEEVAVKTTDDNGRVNFSSLPEGWFSVEVNSDSHGRWKGNQRVNASETNYHQIFISMETVKYNWTVEEIEINDRYRISIESTFETNVPAPVVTVTPPVLDVEDLTVIGQTKVINFTIDNHGWIAAENTKFTFDQHPFYEVTPLIENIGTLQAKGSVIVPVTVRRIGSFDESGNVNSMIKAEKAILKTARNPMSNGVPCAFGGRASYSYICGNGTVNKEAGVPASGSSGGCGGGWFYGGDGNGTGDLKASSSGLWYSSNIQCPTPECVALALAGCTSMPVGPVTSGCIVSVLACANSAATDTARNAFLGCVAAGLGCFTPTSPIGCGMSLMLCFMGDEESKSPSTLRRSQVVPSSDVIDLFRPGVEARIDFFRVLTGSPPSVWLNSQSVQAIGPWFSKMGTFVTSNSNDGMLISIDEKAVLVDLEPPAGVPHSEVIRLIERWNRTVSNIENGINRIDQTPLGMSLDWINLDELEDVAARGHEAEEIAVAAGYSDTFDAIIRTKLAEMNGVSESGVCARVKIRVDQEAVMTRAAFKASLELSNNRPSSELTQVGFNFQVLDLNGAPADDKFSLRVSRMTGLSAIDGSGDIAPLSTGAVQWTLIPLESAAPSENTIYTLGGTITYSLAGTVFSIPVVPVRITVRPDAALHLKYFHQRDVYSDDPHTDVIEPSVPYNLAVLVENRGAGNARNLSITSAQPEIIENEKGLLIDFNIISSHVSGQERSPSLKADFGDLLPHERKVATWNITSSLQGLFIDYEATFEHLDGFGDERLSLMKEVTIHEMVKMIEAQGELSDGLPDFLVNDIPDINDRPDTVHLSDGSTASVTVVENASLSHPVSDINLIVNLNTIQGPGWSYLRIQDPAMGAYKLAGIIRSDGLELQVGKNVWTTDRTFVGLGRRPIYENILHLTDFNSTGQYVLTYELIASDAIPPTSSVKALAAESPVYIPVQWAGQDDRGVAYFDIFVSVDGGPFVTWLSKTTRISSLYIAEAGRLYAFYSRATDTSGNLEPAPLSAQAVTRAGAENQPPALEPIGPLAVNEGEILQYAVRATDPDGSASLLRFSVVAQSNAVTINPETGMLIWRTQETDGARTVEATITVTDGGWPVRTASETILITVYDLNQAPRFLAPPLQVATVGEMMQFSVDATDADLPAQSMTFSLMGAPLAGMIINPTTGLLNWQIADDEEPRLLTIQVLVADNGSPPLSTIVQIPVHLISTEDTAEGNATVIITSVQDIGATSFRADGEVINDGGGTVSERGLVYSSTPNPTILSGTRVSSGSGTGNFTSFVVGLESAKKYYARFYAVNSNGTAYSQETEINTLPIDNEKRYLLFLKAGDPANWTQAGYSGGSHFSEIDVWKNRGFEVAVADAARTGLTDDLLTRYDVVRLFTYIGNEAYPDTSGAVLDRWVRNGGIALIEAAYASGLNAVRRFGVVGINGANGGMTGADWKHRGTPLTIGPVKEPLGPVAQVACENMDSAVLQKGAGLIVAAGIKSDPAIVQGAFGFGKAVIHFMNSWSQDSSSNFHASLEHAGNREYLDHLTEYARLPNRWKGRLSGPIMVAKDANISLGGNWTILSVSGLPPGLTYDKLSSAITGRPTKPGNYSIKVRVRDTNGVSSIETFTFHVEALPASAIGSFIAVLERNGENGDGLGGMLRFKTNAAGSASGHLILANKRHPFKGKLTVITDSQVVFTTLITRGKIDALNLHLDIHDNALISGTLGLGGAAAELSGWRLVWHGRKKDMLAFEVPTPWQGRVNMLMDHASVSWRNAETVAPQGLGFASFTVSKVGAMKLAGRHLDGTTLTLSSTMGPDGQMAFWMPLYKATGSIIMTAALDADGILSGTGDTVRKPQQDKEKLYREGFGHANHGEMSGPVPLTLVGGRWSVLKGSPVMQLSHDPLAPVANVWLEVSDGGIKSDTATETPILPLTITHKNKVLLDSVNPANVKLVIKPLTGFISGSFILRDISLEGRSVKRTVKMYGLFVPGIQDNVLAGGVFALPQLNDTSRILTGRVLLKAKE